MSRVYDNKLKMSRKCFSSIPSSFASIYLITIFFVISFISLLYFKYPQQYINYIDFRIIKVNATSEITTPLLFNEVSKEVVSPVVIPTVLQELEQTPAPVVNISAISTRVDQLSPSPVVDDSGEKVSTLSDVNIPAVDSPFDQLEPPSDVNIPAVSSPVDQLSTPLVVNIPAVDAPVDQLAPSLDVNISAVSSPVDQLSTPSDVKISDASPVDQLAQPLIVNSSAGNVVNQTATPTKKVKKDAKVKKHEQIDPVQAGEGTASVDVNKPEQKQNNKTEDEDEEEDEQSVITYDHISYPPMNFTSEERMEWVKQRIPESKILESTPRTRKFELKMHQFVRDKRCRVKIFMTWISSMGFLGKREILSLESVLKAHPHACVFIISRIMATKPGRQVIQPLLDRGHNILTLPPDFPLLFKHTPAQDWFKRLKAGQVDPGQISLVENLSNLVRVLVLYKYGGIYLDTDMLILKDVSALRNTIGVQEIDKEINTWKSVNNAVMIFDKGHPLLLKFIEEFNSSYNGSAWGYNGPYLATRVIKKHLQDPKYLFHMMSSVSFYPINSDEIHKLFRSPTKAKESKWDTDVLAKVSKESYGVHLWDEFSHDLKVEKGCIIGKLISENCIICQDVYDS